MNSSFIHVTSRPDTMETSVNSYVLDQHAGSSIVTRPLSLGLYSMVENIMFILCNFEYNG